MVRKKATPAKNVEKKEPKLTLARAQADEKRYAPDAAQATRIRPLIQGTTSTQKLILKLPVDVLRRVMRHLSMYSLCRLNCTAKVTAVDDASWHRIAGEMLESDPKNLRCTTSWKETCWDLQTLRAATWNRVSCEGAVPSARSGHTAVMVGSMLYVMGGVAETQNLPGVRC